jgi:hypothetical protein
MGTATGVGSFVMSVCGYIICGFLGVLAATIIIWIWRGKMDLGSLLNEVNGQASMSRFQLLIFTFVIAISLFELVEKSPDNKFPDIPQGVLTLLGISASTYAVGKGISYSQPSTLNLHPTNGTSGSDAKASADQAAAQASGARQAADAAQAAVAQIAGHMATVQQAVDQSAQSAATAQQAADRATGAGGTVNGV